MSQVETALRQICQTPRVYLCDDFASEAEMDHVLAFAADPAGLAARGIGTKQDSTGFSFEMPVTGDPVLSGLAERISRSLGLENLVGQTMRFRKYRVGECHPPHVDNYVIDGASLLLTAMLGLLATTSGGGTLFAESRPQALLIRPRRGRLVAWFNHRPDGQKDPQALHEGLAVTSGEKATITAFIYQSLDRAACSPPNVAAQVGPAGSATGGQRA